MKSIKNPVLQALFNEIWYYHATSPKKTIYVTNTDEGDILVIEIWGECSLERRTGDVRTITWVKGGSVTSNPVTGELTFVNCGEEILKDAF